MYAASWPWILSAALQAGAVAFGKCRGKARRYGLATPGLLPRQVDFVTRPINQTF